MRTTVTLDDDVEQLLRDAAHRTRRSFKATLNDAVRAALGSRQPRRPFVIEARDLGLRPGFDPTGFNKLLDDLDAEALQRPGP